MLRRPGTIRVFSTPFHRTEEIRGIPAPVLAVVGSEDSFKPSVDALKALMPALEVVVIQEADHVSILNAPQLGQAIRDFLRR